MVQARFPDRLRGRRAPDPGSAVRAWVRWRPAPAARVGLVVEQAGRIWLVKNEYAYRGKLWSDIEAQGKPSKWVTLRACRVLKLAHAQIKSLRGPHDV